MSDFNFVDLIILAIFGISILAGLVRGLLKELISLLSWVAASIIASLFASKLAASFSGSGTEIQSVVTSTAGGAGGTASAASVQAVSMLALGASFLALFVLTLIAGSIVNYIITSATEGRGIGLTNRLFGGAFGAARAFVVVVMLMFVTELTPVSSQSFWTSSQFVSAFQPSVDWFSGIVSPEIQALKAQAEQAVQGVGGSIQQGVTGGVQSIYQGIAK